MRPGWPRSPKPPLPRSTPRPLPTQHPGTSPVPVPILVVLDHVDLPDGSTTALLAPDPDGRTGGAAARPSRPRRGAIARDPGHPRPGMDARTQGVATTQTFPTSDFRLPSDPCRLTPAVDAILRPFRPPRSPRWHDRPDRRNSTCPRLTVSPRPRGVFFVLLDVTSPIMGHRHDGPVLAHQVRSRR